MRANPEMISAKQEFKGYIVKLYGTQHRMAKSLGVSQQAVGRWMNENPRGLLKYLPEIVEQTNTTYSQVIWEVIALEKALQGGNA